MGCAGNSEIRTPTLDRLATEGIRFDNFFCTSPVCSPARASILTGRMPSQHGVLDWLCGGNSPCEPASGKTLTEYLAGQPAYTDLLAARGYVCGLSGKWHLGDAHHAQKGFTYWNTHARGGGDYYYAPMVKNESEYYYETRYVTDAITDHALEFLEQRPTAAPFCLHVHYTAPHSPWERGQHPPEFFEPYFSECGFATIPTVPYHPWGRSFPKFFSDEAYRREALSGYFAAVTAMDASVGRLLRALEKQGVREQTLVVFMSDNGMNMGHHGICGKGNGTYPQNMYDSSVMVPCIMSRPGSVPEGLVCDELYSQYDVLPTLLEYAGVENTIGEGLPGASFAALLQGGPAPARDDVVVYDEYGPVRMIRSRTHKYVHRYSDGPDELYDLANDPDETTNLVGMPAHAATVVQMLSRLESWFDRYSRREFDGRDRKVSGNGQSGLASLPQDGDSPFAQTAGPWWKPGEEPPPQDAAAHPAHPRSGARRR